jgi:hypothetical protein
MMELLDILQLLLPLAVVASTALTIFIATLPQIYDPSTKLTKIAMGSLGPMPLSMWSSSATLAVVHACNTTP